MQAAGDLYRRVCAAIEAVGLSPRGGFHPGPGDAVPALADGGRPGTVVLAGHVGRSMWPAFAASPEARRGGRDPLDTWSRRVLAEVGAGFGASVVLPSDGPPYAPFQRWARRAEPLHPSPLGLLIHPGRGLWHGWRGALLLPEAAVLPVVDAAPPPCASCAGKPCLAACPVGAFTQAGYDVAACRGHLETPAGRECLDRGCRARAACPVGAGHAYGPEQIRFHMAAFRGG